MNIITSPELRIVRMGDDWWAMNLENGRRQRVAPLAARLLLYCRTLRDCSRTAGRFSSVAVKELLSGGLLWEEGSLWSADTVRAVEIETTTQCNWRCAYCPSHEAQRRPQVMPLLLFDRVLKRIAEYPGIRQVTLHYFNEPTLDPFFDQRVEHIGRQGLRLLLFTNGSGLSRERLEGLWRTGIVERIYFTFPSADEGQFDRLTGTKGAMGHSAGMIRAAIEQGFDVRLSVPGTPEGKRERVRAVCELFSLPRAKIAPWETFDRAGRLRNPPYCRHTCLDRPLLYGCGHILRRLYVDVEGELLLCDQDFEKTARFGSVCDSSFGELLNASRAQAYRRWIFGGEEAPKPLLCRRCQRMQAAQRQQAKEAAALALPEG